MPKRRATETYWTEEQFQQLVASPPGKLYSRGQLPWRVLVHALQATSDVAQLRTLISKRLMDAPRIVAGQRHLDDMLITLWKAGYLQLEPTPDLDETGKLAEPNPSYKANAPTQDDSTPSQSSPTLFGQSLSQPRGSKVTPAPARKSTTNNADNANVEDASDVRPRYQAERAVPTERLERLAAFRGINPLYGDFLVNHLGIANESEILQITESALELAVPVARLLRVPPRDKLLPGPLANERIDPLLLSLGLATEEQLLGSQPNEDGDRFDREEKVWPLTLAEKMKMLFEHQYPAAGNVRIQPVWAIGELFEFRGDFNKFVIGHKLQKQEGLIFRHMLRMVLLLGEFDLVCPPDTSPDIWAAQIASIRDRIVESCQQVDPSSTQRTLEQIADG